MSLEIQLPHDSDGSTISLLPVDTICMSREFLIEGLSAFCEAAPKKSYRHY